jgi:peptide/nickel transport system substrate-binding protein
MNIITRRDGMALALAAAGAGLARGARAEARNVLVGGFDVGPGGLQNNFNPLAATAGLTWLNLYYEPLIFYNAALTATEGALAKSMTTNAALTEYTFALDPDAKWHDGQPFTAADVKFTFDLAKDPRSGSVFAASTKIITEVRTPDPHTAVLVLARPSASLPDLLTKIMMLPQHALASQPLDGLDRNPWWRTAPIGTGPFRFVRYATDQYVELAANADFRRGRPKLDGVINRYFKSTADAVAALQAGEIQFSYVEPDDLKSFAGKQGFRTIEGNSFVVNYVGLNYLTPLWNDLRVRQAVIHAINRAAIVKSILGGAAEVANCTFITPNVVPGDLDTYPYDPAKAKQLLAAAGWDKLNGSKPLAFPTYYNSPIVGNILAAMQAMLGQVGIVVQPRQIDVPSYNGIIYGKPADPGQFPIVYAGAQDGPDPGAINTFLNASAIPPNGANVMRVNMAELSGAFDAAMGEADPAKRQAAWQTVSRIQNRQLPWAPMWVAKRYGIVSAKVQNFVWTPAPGGGGYQSNAQNWALG